MNRELLLLVDALAREKNVAKEIVFTALESALASATKKRFPMEIDARVSIDRETGDYDSFRRWTVVPDEDHEEPAYQIAITDGGERGGDLKLGDVLEWPIEPVEIGRIRAQAADELHLGAEPAAAARTRRDNQFVDIGIALDDRRRGRLDEVRDVGLWKAPPDRSNGRRREDDVPDLPQADQQDLQSSIVASSMSITGMSSLIG